jgi:Ca2+-binding EF-hand superfamily protein
VIFEQNSNQTLDFPNFVRVISSFVKLSKIILMSLMFKIHDVSSDSLICEHDIFSLFQECKSTENVETYLGFLKQDRITSEIHIPDPENQLFFKAFSKDIFTLSFMIKSLTKPKEKVEMEGIEKLVYDKKLTN